MFEGRLPVINLQTATSYLVGMMMGMIYFDSLDEEIRGDVGAELAVSL